MQRNSVWDNTACNYCVIVVNAAKARFCNEQRFALKCVKLPSWCFTLEFGRKCYAVGVK